MNIIEIMKRFFIASVKKIHFVYNGCRPIVTFQLFQVLFWADLKARTKIIADYFLKHDIIYQLRYFSISTI